MNTAPSLSHLRSLQSLEPADGARLAVLRVRNRSTMQRELTCTLGLSLCKTHYLLHTLLDTGVLKVQSFRCSGNKLAYACLLTPSGLRHRVALTLHFIRQMEAEFETLQRSLALLPSELQGDVRGR